MHEAMFYKKAGGIMCRLCPRCCKLGEGQTGLCLARKNISGKLIALTYGKPCSIALDPVEKKPLFHFAPGSQTLSVATVGCNLKCAFCQNFEISQPESVFGKDVSPEELAGMINGYPGFSWTYTEPTVFFEYFYDTAKLTRGVYHVWVSNGYTSPGAIRKAAKFVDAVNIDYKGDAPFYNKLCLAKLEHVQESLLLYKKLRTWIEITNLIIPGQNDRPEQIKEMVSWIADNLGQVPLHFSRFFPMHKLHAPETPLKTLEKAAEIAEKQLDHVYIGNVRSEKENTYCHNCKTLLIERHGFGVSKFFLKKKGRSYRCLQCNAKIPLAGMKWSKLEWNRD